MGLADIGSDRGDGWQEVTCDAPDCDQRGEFHMNDGLPEGWVRKQRGLVLTTASGVFLCPRHAASE